METEADEACQDIFRPGQSYPDWEQGRAWSQYDPDRLGLSFESRLVPVPDRQ